ncbi:hypothetical protein Fmac_000796 [Flemingia macrophylla]|uniref:Proline dehydrogenase n=1 Tax=Flemingia macrophylla TaxID=520843 RepID=A0ABD1NF94_9FABA
MKDRANRLEYDYKVVNNADHIQLMHSCRSDVRGGSGGGAHGGAREGKRRRQIGGRGCEGRWSAWQRSRGEAEEAEIATGGGGDNSHGKGPNPFSASAMLSATCCCVCRRRLSFSSSSPVLPPPTSVLRPAATDDLNFNDHHKLFSHLPTSYLLCSAAVLHATAVDPLVDFDTWLLRSNLMNVNGLREILLASVRHFFYNHFCAGKDAPRRQEHPSPQPRRPPRHARLQRRRRLRQPRLRPQLPRLPSHR